MLITEEMVREILETVFNGGVEVWSDDEFIWYCFEGFEKKHVLKTMTLGKFVKEIVDEAEKYYTKKGKSLAFDGIKLERITKH